MANEPFFMLLGDKDPAVLKTVRDAQESLPRFLGWLQRPGAHEWHPGIKTRLKDGEHSAFIWLLVVAVYKGTFIGSVFEIPPNFGGFKVGDEIEVTWDAVADWMIIKEGVLYGGYSLRLMRSRLPPEEVQGWDERLGVTKYA